jgi:ABC-2 type transport system permease protein
VRAIPNGRWTALVDETRKIPAFIRRDFLVQWSYRFAFFSDWLNLILQVVLFYFVGRLVDPDRLPALAGGVRPTYVEFVTVGIAVTSVLQVGLSRVVSVTREEQLMGTLESLLLTPTAPTTVQLGSVMYDLLYVPLRTLVFLGLTVAFFGADFNLSGLLPAGVVLLAFIPVVWGLGMISAAGVLTFRRGLGFVGLFTVLLTGTSSTYFPVEVFPGWLQTIARLNPITRALQASRDALLGDAGWADVLPTVAWLVPTAALALAAGVFAFRLATKRERRRGTLGLY